jgi:hypothetical protein
VIQISIFSAAPLKDFACPGSCGVGFWWSTDGQNITGGMRMAQMGAICDGKIATLTSTKRNDLNLFCKLGFSELFSYPKTQHCCTRGSASETAQSVTFQLETHHQQRDKKRRSFF